MTARKALYTIVLNDREGNTERMPEPGRQTGFTIVELLITLVVVVLLLSLAAPSFSSLVQKRRITSISEQLASFLVIAQSESVKRNQQLTVTFDSNNATDWCIGMALGNALCDCANAAAANYCEIDNVAKTIVSTSVRNVQLSGIADNLNQPNASSAAFTYDPVRGLMVNPADSGSFTFLTDNGKFSLQVEVSGTGRVDVCNPDSSKKVVGFDGC